MSERCSVGELELEIDNGLATIQVWDDEAKVVGGGMILPVEDLDVLVNLIEKLQNGNL